ncbi:hypothetical protein J4E85_009515 [Alternaria conjuncta]|uniref:uncharacterized protein n=1 Tax=Alternaria conjuncta TaxID=181017 RepID=UPI00221F7670|nr:uncharacterized protein J4E85_009515 [Alternaria conjuncta]KAI4919257.1 hypothetical protein J4E85_009515 [Alternaria conjuncta]
MEREYEFFVTTDKPYNPAGAERYMIRRLVMRNHFDMKMAGPQINPSQHSSISTAMAKKKLKNRFRISEPRIKKKKVNSRKTEDIRRSKEKGAARPNDLRDRSEPRTSSKAGEDGKDKREDTDETLAPGLKCGLDDDRIDPSKASPIPETPGLNALFQLYKSAPRNNAVAIDAQHTWKSLISSDAGLLHATLASWALYGMLANEPTDLRVCKLKHKNEAIKAVNCKLATSGGCISDEVVGTVLTLANLENLLGDYEAAELHVTALKRMVKLRGGLFAFGHNDGLLRGIIW